MDIVLPVPEKEFRNIKPFNPGTESYETCSASRVKAHLRSLLRESMARCRCHALGWSGFLSCSSRMSLCATSRLPETMLKRVLSSSFSFAGPFCLLRIIMPAIKSRTTHIKAQKKNVSVMLPLYFHNTMSFSSITCPLKFRAMSCRKRIQKRLTFLSMFSQDFYCIHDK